MLNDNDILVRRVRYGCCALSLGAEVATAQTYGDVECAKRITRSWLYMIWAKSIMDAVPVGDEDTDCGDVAFATAVAATADCICTSCSGPGGSVPYTGDTSCDINVSQTVIEAVPVSDRAAIEGAGPDTGDAYLIISGTTDGVWTTNTIQTWNGIGWTQTAVVAGQIIATENVPNPSYWITPIGASEPGNLFPAINVSWDSMTSLYDFTSDYPLVNQFMGRGLIIQVISGTGGWVTVFSGQEAELALGIALNLGGLNPTETQAIYYKGDCFYTSQSTTTPPFGECGTLNVTYTSSQNCATGQFFLTANITSATNYPIGGIMANVDGVDQPITPASLGSTTLGGFPSTSEVFLRIINSFNSECDVVSDTFVSPIFPSADYTVLSAVDASFQGSAVPGQSYLIVSDTTDAGNSWAANVGKIWNGTIFITPDDGAVILATSATGATGYWQMSGTTPVQVYPPATFRYNTLTEVYTTVPSPIATFVAGTYIEVYLQCPGGDPQSVYTGPIEGYEASSFTPDCLLVSGDGGVTYYTECPIDVPSVVVPFTPDGEVDPDFSTGGLNSFVVDAAIDDQDNILVVGNFTQWTAGPISVGRLCRLDPNGELDTAFNTAIGTGFNAVLRVVLVDSDGGYICAGDFTDFNGTTVGRIARILPDGTLDATFQANIGTGFNFPVFGVTILPDQTLIVTGSFSTFNGGNRYAIAKLSPTGVLDPTFDGEFSNTAGISRYDPVTDTLILNANTSIFYNASAIRPVPAADSLFRVNKDTGAFIELITIGTMFNSPITWAEMQPDGKIVVVGTFTAYNGIPTGYLVRLNGNGTIDTGFQTKVGTGMSGETTRALLLPNGQIAVGVVDPSNTFNGSASKGLVLLDPDGERDFSYNNGAGYTGGRTNRIVIQSTGSLVVTGGFTQLDSVPRLRVARVL